MDGFSTKHFVRGTEVLDSHGAKWTLYQTSPSQMLAWVWGRAIWNAHAGSTKC